MTPAQISSRSLELQTWWRDHQEHDKARLQREMKDKKDAKSRRAALKKLSPRERKLLGV